MFAAVVSGIRFSQLGGTQQLVKVWTPSVALKTPIIDPRFCEMRTVEKSKQFERKEKSYGTNGRERDPHIGETAGAANHDHDMIHISASVWTRYGAYDQYIANAKEDAELSGFWKM